VHLYIVVDCKTANCGTAHRVAVVEKVLGLYREKYFDPNVRHFHGSGRHGRIWGSTDAQRGPGFRGRAWMDVI